MATTFSCNKCGSIDLYVKSNGTQVGLYCSDCGKWIKWIGKEEQRLVERQIEKNKAVSEDKPIENDLSEFSDEELLNEIKRRMG